MQISNMMYDQSLGSMRVLIIINHTSRKLYLLKSKEIKFYC